MRYQEKTPPSVFAAIGVSLVALFTVDCLTPLGWAEWVLYLVPVALCVKASQPRTPILVALSSSVLLVVGYFMSPPSVMDDVALYNRTFGFVVVWSVALLTHQVLVARATLRKRDWLRTGQARLSEVARGDKRADEVANAMVEFVASYLNAQVGAMYVRDAQEHLSRRGGVALDPDEPAGREFRMGEGLVGQVARSAAPLVVRDVPADYAKVRSGVGAHAPRELLLAPLTADQALYGVIELGFFAGTVPEDLELLELLAEPMGVALRTAEYRTRLQELLEETQAQAEELEAQQEELRANNEELEQQSEVLREQQTNLEQQQAELEQSNVQLEEHAQQLVEQKAEVLASREELAQKASELEAASRYKSEFLANMSHELRTPLNSTLILAKLLADNRDQNLTPEQVRYAQNISSAGNDLLELINDVLDLSKIEAGMMEVKPEVVRLARFTETLLPPFQVLAQQKGLELALSIAPFVPAHLVTDAQRLRQILKNLLSNALKFTDRGRVSLTIQQARGGRIAFVVADTGIGISEAQHELVFEAFRQGDGGANRKYQGTGLGLSISRDLARLLGGDITLASDVGRGSTFTLELPEKLAELEAPSLSPPAPARLEPRAFERPESREPRAKAFDFDDDRDSLSGSKRVLLVVEDDPVFARLLLDLARGEGFKAVVTSMADEGVELAMRLRPAAILLDLNLPDHSGLTVLDRLKSMPGTRHIPVHVVSARDSTQTALEMGAAGYTLKPVERAQVLEALKNLERKSSQGMRSVLVVEDDPMQRESICKLLETSDVRTVPVESAGAALVELASTTHDCVVLDLTLADGSGYDLLEKMAEDDAYSFPPVIIYTGRSLSSEEEQRLRRYSKSIIIKGARSPERLLDEVTLFLHQVETRLPPDRQRMLAEARSRDRAFDGRRVLLVEDDVRNVFALTSVLEQRGAKLHIARNGREALELLGKQPDFDVVLMDIMMPEMDGFAAMRAIRAELGLQKLPIIALTAKAMRDDQEMCLKAGANDYIAKPVVVDKLLSLMRVWMPK